MLNRPDVYKNVHGGYFFLVKQQRRFSFGDRRNLLYDENKACFYF